MSEYFAMMVVGLTLSDLSFLCRQHGGRHGCGSRQRVFTRAERTEDFNH